MRQNGRAIEDVNTSVGFVPQQAQLFPWKTLAENVELPLLCARVAPKERERRGREIIAAVGLRGFEHYYPHQLSGGMQKRGSIARTLMYRPELILMDEPFGALDAQTRMVMQEDLQTLIAAAGGTTSSSSPMTSPKRSCSPTMSSMLSRAPRTRAKANIAIDLPRPRNVFEPFRTQGFDRGL